jgi:hypothetical protein
MAGITWGGEQRTTVSIIVDLYVFSTLSVYVLSPKLCNRFQWSLLFSSALKLARKI